MKKLTEKPRIDKRKIRSISSDPEKTAAAVNLVYVNDAQPGIKRLKRGREFIYVYRNKPVKKEEILARIRKIVIPPAWENVWICALPNGHLQATGLDAKKRKQYKYHPSWNEYRNQTKFYRLLEFGKNLAAIRERIKKDLALPGLPLNKVLAAVVSLMENTSIRVGNNMYEKLYGSYGLTTLKDKHVKLSGPNMHFSFKGKKGVHQKISLKSKRLSAIVKQCRDIPGKELFQYYDEQGAHKCIDSGMVNHYLKEITGKDFTSKDFRTWSGTLHALKALQACESAKNKTECKKNIIAALDTVADHLGNTRSVCRKYYIHPVVISLYETNRLDHYFLKEQNDTPPEISVEENIMMKILEKEALANS
jgi:DNA topoisomerase I